MSRDCSSSTLNFYRGTHSQMMLKCRETQMGACEVSRTITHLMHQSSWLWGEMANPDVFSLHYSLLQLFEAEIVTNLHLNWACTWHFSCVKCHMNASVDGCCYWFWYSYVVKFEALIFSAVVTVKVEGKQRSQTYLCLLFVILYPATNVSNHLTCVKKEISRVLHNHCVT